MSVQRIAARYATSLIELAKEQNKLEAVTEDMKTLKAMIANRDLLLLLKSPVVPASKKKAVFKLLFEGKLDEMTSAFIDILTTKAREAYLPEVVDDYMVQYRRLKHISTVKLTTAIPLKEGVVEEVREKLKSSGVTSNSMEFTLEVDPALIGGFVLELEDKVYDASLLDKIKGLRRQFRENLYISKVAR